MEMDARAGPCEDLSRPTLWSTVAIPNAGAARPAAPVGDRSVFVLSDSGGLQEEVTAPGIGKSIIVLRTSTERPGAVEAHLRQVHGLRGRYPP
jgi:hypothetical protein